MSELRQLTSNGTRDVKCGEVRGQSQVVRIYLLHFPHQLLLVRLCQLLHASFANYVTKICTE